MANWLASTDAVILFTGSAVLDCNEAALRLFAYSSKAELLANTPTAFLFQQQPDSLNASERLLMLALQAQQEGFCKGAVVGCRADGSCFYVNLVIITETLPNTEKGLYCTKWLPMNTFELGQAIPEDYLIKEPIVHTSTGLLQLSTNGELVEVNETLSAWLGYTPDEFVRKISLQNLLQDEAFARKLKEPYTTASLADMKTMVLKAKDGALKRFHVATVKHINGSGVLRLLLKQEEVKLQDREFHKQELERLKQENRSLKRVQRVLQRNMERLRVLADYSPDVIMQFDRNHRHVFVNSQVGSQSPYTVEDFLGKTHLQIGFPEEFSKICSEALNKVFTSRQRNRLDLELPNGQWVDLVLIPEFSPSGEVTSVITTARDITEQKRTAVELQKSQQRLKDAFEVTKLSSWEYVVEEDELLLNEQLRDLLYIPNEVQSIQGIQF